MLIKNFVLFRSFTILLVNIWSEAKYSEMSGFKQFRWFLATKKKKETSIRMFKHNWNSVWFFFFQIIIVSILQIVIIIIIMSCRQHGYPWPSLATSPYHSSPPAGLQRYILCPRIVAGRPAFARPYVGVHRSTSHELVHASPAVSRVSGSSNLYSFRDGGQVSV